MSDNKFCKYCKKSVAKKFVKRHVRSNAHQEKKFADQLGFDKPFWCEPCQKMVIKARKRHILSESHCENEDNFNDEVERLFHLFSCG